MNLTFLVDIALSDCGLWTLSRQLSSKLKSLICLQNQKLLNIKKKQAVKVNNSKMFLQQQPSADEVAWKEFLTQLQFTMFKCSLHGAKKEASRKRE